MAKPAKPRSASAPKFGTEASYRLMVEQILSNFEVQAQRGLPSLPNDGRFVLLAHAWIRSLEKVALCRRCIEEGPTWALAYHLLTIGDAPWSQFMADKGERAWRAGRKGSSRRSTADRDINMALQYLNALRQKPKAGEVRLKQAIGKDWGIKPATSVKAIGRGLRLLKK